MAGFSRPAFESLFASPFRITKSYISEVVRCIYARRNTCSRESDFTAFPAEAIFLNRLQFGLLSVVARFDAVVDYAAVEVASLKKLVRPPRESSRSSAPSGRVEGKPDDYLRAVGQIDPSWVRRKQSSACPPHEWPRLSWAAPAHRLRARPGLAAGNPTACAAEGTRRG